MNEAKEVVQLPHVSVIIPHLNQFEALSVCLTSLAAQSYPAALVEILVVDNGSIHSCESVTRQFDGIRLLMETEPGPGPARNRGIAAASHALLAFIDADCRADPDWLATAVAALETNDSTGVVGGDVRIDAVSSTRLTPIEAYESVFAFRQRMYIARDHFSGTGNLAMRRVVFEQVGPFAGIGIAEDRDWGQRATAQGFPPRYAGNMKVFHPARLRFGDLCEKWRRHIAHDLETHRMTGKSNWRWRLKSAAMIASVVPHAAMLLTSGRLTGFGNRLKGVRILAKIRQFRAVEMLRQARLSGESHATGWNRGG